MLKIFPPVRFYFFCKVADVFIATPDEVSLPPIGRRYFTEEGITGGLSQEASPKPLSEDEGAVSVIKEQERGEVILPNLSLGQDRIKREEGSSVYAAAPDFHLDPSSKGKTGFSLNLIVPKKAPEDVPDERASRDLELSRLFSPGLSSLRFNRIEKRKKALQAGSSLTDHGIGSQQVDFDVTPWAKEVLDKIRNGWIVPPIEESIARGEAKILVVIGKDGKLIGLEVVESSNFILFDESAVKAIRSSAPFLPLPDDFPADRLETLLVFEFNE